MSTPAKLAGKPPASWSPAGSGPTRRPLHRLRRAGTSLFAVGEPMIWFTGGSLAIAMAMIAGLLGLVFWNGVSTFWPLPVVRVETPDGRLFMGEITRHERFRPDEFVLQDLTPEIRETAGAMLAAGDGWAVRRLIRTGNFRLTQTHFQWVSDFEVAARDHPEWAMVVERREWGRFYGFPEGFIEIEELPPAEAAAGSGGAEEDREAARRILDRRMQEQPGEYGIVVQRWQDGGEQDVLVPVSELETAGGIVGVARVYRRPEAAWDRFRRHYPGVRAEWNRRRSLEKYDTGAVNKREEKARLAMRAAGLEADRAERRYGTSSTQYRSARAAYDAAATNYDEVRAWADGEFARIRAEIDDINRRNSRYRLILRTAGEGDQPAQTSMIPLDRIVRAYPANRLSLGARLRVYLARWWEFLADEPREANSEGGVFPAIFGTVVMTLIMSVAVVPFGVLAALYLREYAKPGPMVSSVRIAVNNLAGVPSIVFGVFGLGFFCYILGASLDQVLFAARLPNPTYGRGGLLWASLTLALLTLPVVIVATEEALAAVPGSMREGSYACGASKWQTIRRIVLPRAMPGITTGMILAIARGAGEVAPLMLVGAVKLAPELPIDTVFPFLHPERSFMHLGFHIYDVGFQSQNSEAAKPMVYTTTLLLIGIVAVLNVAAVWLRTRLRRRFVAGYF